MAEAFTYATQSIDRLLDEHPDRAAIILARCYRKDKEVKDEIDSILQLSGPGRSQASRAPSNSAIPVPSHGSSIRDHKYSSSSQPAPTPHHHRGTTKSNAAPTPPGSSSARSSKGSSASGETILLIDNHEDDIETFPVVLRTDPTTEFSLIREDIVNDWMTGVEPEEDCHYTIRHPGMAGSPGALTEIHISRSVLLTWRRPKSGGTHRTTFFLVPRHVLSTDVLLGYRDLERDPGFPSAGAAPHPHRQGYRDTDYQQEVQSPTVVPNSFHRSQHEPGPYQTRSRHQFKQQPMEGYQFHQAQPDLNEGNPPSMQPPPMPTSRSTRPMQKDHTKSTPPSVQTPSNNSEAPNRKLRLSLKWDKTPVNLWLDLDSSAEVFFQTLRDVSKRRQVHNWDSCVVWLKTEPQSPEESAYRLALGADLDADWGITVDWLEQNKRTKPPHICGTFEFEEGG